MTRFMLASRTAGFSLAFAAAISTVLLAGCGHDTASARGVCQTNTKVVGLGDIGSIQSLSEGPADATTYEIDNIGDQTFLNLAGDKLCVIVKGGVGQYSALTISGNDATVTVVGNASGAELAADGKLDELVLTSTKLSELKNCTGWDKVTDTSP